jgi:hypothetical protein
MQALLPGDNIRGRGGYILGQETGSPVNRGIILDQLAVHSAHRILDIDNLAQ